MLEIQGLSKTFRGRASPAVDHLNLEVREGEIVGLVGLNGAGKTTTIRVAAGVSLPTSGTVLVNGLNVVDDKAEAGRHVGWVSEFPNFEPGGRSLGLLRYHAGFYGLHGPETDTLCRELLSRVGLEGEEKTRFRAFSQGMKKRFALARSLLGDPNLLLLDEVLNGLDPEGVHFVRKLMLELRGQGKAILLSSHILAEVQQVADRVAVVHNGHLVRVLTQEDIARAAGKVLRVVLSRLDDDALEYFHTLGEVRREGNTAWVTDPSHGPEEVGAELIRRGYRISEMIYETRSLESIFLELIGHPKETGP